MKTSLGSRYKNIGEIWTRLSKGRVLFLLAVKNKNSKTIDEQIKEKSVIKAYGERRRKEEAARKREGEEQGGEPALAEGVGTPGQAGRRRKKRQPRATLDLFDNPVGCLSSLAKCPAFCGF